MPSQSWVIFATEIQQQKFPRGDNLDKKVLSRVSRQQNY